MKLCDIVQFYSPLGGGVRRYIEDKMRLFSQINGVEHSVIIPSDRNRIETRFKTTIYHVQSLPLLGSLSYRALLNRNRILDIVNEVSPDVIEVGDPYRSAWIALDAGETLGIPVVAFYHSDFPRALGRTLRRFIGHRMEHMLSNPVRRYVIRLYNRMSATVVASSRMEEELRADGIESVVRIPLGTDIEEFRPHPYPQPMRDELGLKDKDTLIIFVGRLAREKNIRCLLEMMDRLETNPGGPGRCHLLLVGDGELRRLVQRRLNHSRSITWKQYCHSTSQLTRYYTASDVLVHAGCYETFGITSLEAQACGCRVVSIRGGGLDDTVAGEDPLIQAESPSPDHLAGAIRRVRQLEGGQTPEQRRHRIVEQFSIDMTVRRLVGLYRHLADNKPLEQFDPDHYATHSSHHSSLSTFRP